MIRSISFKAVPLAPVSRADRAAARTRSAAVLGASLALFAWTDTVHAEPAAYVVSPIVEEGEREIDFKFGTAKLRESTRETQQSLGLGLGVNEHWFTELYAIWHQEPGAARAFDAWEWENKFQLTETGRYPVDLGLLLEVERPKDRSEGYEYRWGPLLQADLTNEIQGNLNILFEKRIRVAEAEAAELGYQWQLKYRWKPQLEFGLQGFGDVGPWDHWEAGSQQPHIAGPALFGEVNAGAHQVIKYNAAVLFGLTDGAPRNTFRMQAEFEF